MKNRKCCHCWWDGSGERFEEGIWGKVKKQLEEEGKLEIKSE